jgi:hypothetical protein
MLIADPTSRSFAGAAARSRFVANVTVIVFIADGNGEVWPARITVKEFARMYSGAASPIEAPVTLRRLLVSGVIVASNVAVPLAEMVTVRADWAVGPFVRLKEKMYLLSRMRHCPAAKGNMREPEVLRQMREPVVKSSVAHCCATRLQSTSEMENVDDAAVDVPVSPEIVTLEPSA